MATTTEKLGLKKPADEDYIYIDDINGNMDIIDRTVGTLQEDVASTKKSVSDGKTLVANAITAKGIDTAADAAFATMAENIEEIVTLENGTEDATATAEQILLDMKAYVKGLPVIGTMPNNGAVSGALNCGGSYKIPKGYHDGNGVITANSLASQTVGTATAAQILSGKTAWANGEKITGTIQSQAAQTITPGTANKTIAAGKYLSGVQTIKGDSNLKADNIKKGVSIFGVAGDCITVDSNDTLLKGFNLLNMLFYNAANKSDGIFSIKKNDNNKSCLCIGYYDSWVYPDSCDYEIVTSSNKGTLVYSSNDVLIPYTDFVHYDNPITFTFGIYLACIPVNSANSTSDVYSGGSDTSGTKGWKNMTKNLGIIDCKWYAFITSSSYFLNQEKNIFILFAIDYAKEVIMPNKILWSNSAYNNIYYCKLI